MAFTLSSSTTTPWVETTWPRSATFFRNHIIFCLPPNYYSPVFPRQPVHVGSVPQAFYYKQGCRQKTLTQTYVSTVEECHSLMTEKLLDHSSTQTEALETHNDRRGS